MLTKIQETTIRREVTGIDGKHHFGMWLFAINDNVAGKAVDHGHCPLATYIRAIFERHINDVGLASVDQTNIFIYYGDELEHTIRFRTPVWARKFICQLDQGYAAGSDVIGSEALEVLEVA